MHRSFLAARTLLRLVEELEYEVMSLEVEQLFLFLKVPRLEVGGMAFARKISVGTLPPTLTRLD